MPRIPTSKIARATNAADVHVVGRGDLAALAHAPGVKAAEGPFRLLGVRVRSRPTNYNLALEGVGARPPRIDHPKLTERPLAVRRARRARARPPDRAQTAASTSASA